MGYSHHSKNFDFGKFKIKKPLATARTAQDNTTDQNSVVALCLGFAGKMNFSPGEGT